MKTFKIMPRNDSFRCAVIILLFSVWCHIETKLKKSVLVIRVVINLKNGNNAIHGHLFQVFAFIKMLMIMSK